MIDSPLPPPLSLSEDSDVVPGHDERDETELPAAVPKAVEAMEEPFWIARANLYPGQGMRLYLQTQEDSSCSTLASKSLPDTNRIDVVSSAATLVIDLKIGQTTTQDALCDLGSPDGKTWKEKERMEIHHRRHATGRSEQPSPPPPLTAGGGHVGSSPSASSTGSPGLVASDSKRRLSSQDMIGVTGAGAGAAARRKQGQPFFFNYHSLGFDLLFDYSTAPSDDSLQQAGADSQIEEEGGGPVLSKIICHTNSPGHALFGRYQRLPWRLARAGERMLADADTAQGGELPDVSDAMCTYTELLPRFVPSPPLRTEHVKATSIESTATTPLAVPGGASVSRRSASSSSTTSSIGKKAKSPLSSSPSVSAAAATTAGASLGNKSAQDETMLLDRGSNPVEFKSRLRLDVASSLHGHPGIVLEINEADQKVASITLLTI